MALRFYLSQVIGTGMKATDPQLQDPFRPALSLVASRWAADDFRLDQTVSAGRMICWADVTDAEHTAIIADNRNAYLPLELSDGSALTIADVISRIPAAKRTALRTALEANGVPTDDLVATDTIKKIISRIARRIRIRRAMANADFTESLDTLVSSLSAARRQAIATPLTAKGYDTSVILGADTIRQAIQKLAAQNVRWHSTMWD